MREATVDLTVPVSEIRVEAGEWLTVYLAASDHTFTAELRVTPEGEAEIFVEEDVRVLPWKRWYGIP